MAYDKQTWTNGVTPRNEARLNHQEEGIAEAHRLHEVGIGGMNFDAVNVGESTTSTAWVDLMTVGPEVNVTLDSSVAGVRAIVVLSAQIRSGFATSGDMGVEVIGPSNRDPSLERALRFRPHAAGGDGHIQASTMFAVTALAPGAYTFRAKYRSSEGLEVIFNTRRMLVLPLPV